MRGAASAEEAMRPTTPPKPVRIERTFPELQSPARTTVRLHSRPGRSDTTENSLGGPAVVGDLLSVPLGHRPHERTDCRGPSPVNGPIRSSRSIVITWPRTAVIDRAHPTLRDDLKERWR